MVLPEAAAANVPAEALLRDSWSSLVTHRRRVAMLTVAAAAGVALGCASAEGARRKDHPVGRVEEGKASFYGRGFAGRKTASGERFDPSAMTAAHPSLPFGTRVRVSRANGASVTVRINDRCGCPGGRIVDLSEGAARRLGMIKEGVVAVRLEVIGK
jgi:rare lipoprotein A (peptidoglycan hydrolase)